MNKKQIVEILERLSLYGHVGVCDEYADEILALRSDRYAVAREVWDEFWEYVGPMGDTDEYGDYLDRKAGEPKKAEDFNIPITDEQIATAIQGMKFSDSPDMKWENDEQVRKSANYLNNEATMKKRGIETCGDRDCLFCEEITWKNKIQSLGDEVV